jgi:Zn finger protein HypA/HybF involved in hydrogenase expression
MMDLNEVEIDLKCPKCNFLQKVKMRQVSNEEKVICPNCKTEIQLKDKDGSTKKGIKNVNNAFNELQKTIYTVLKTKIL